MMHAYEVRPRKDKRGIDLISDALPFCRLWYSEPDAISNAVNYAKFYSRSHDAVIRVYDEAGNVIETHEHAGDFKATDKFTSTSRPSRSRKMSHSHQPQVVALRCRHVTCNRPGVRSAQSQKYRPRPSLAPSLISPGSRREFARVPRSSGFQSK